MGCVRSMGGVGMGGQGPRVGVGVGARDGVGGGGVFESIEERAATPAGGGAHAALHDEFAGPHVEDLLNGHAHLAGG